MNKIAVWHLEPTNRCTIACPKCPRTIWPDRLQQSDLKIEDLQHFFTGKILEDTEQVIFCGNHGDPIYHPEFGKMLQFFIDIKPEIDLKIITNGAHRTSTWWDNILSILRPQDKINLSIDGLEDTNHLYRVNSKWSSVQIALEALSTSASITIWRFIVFKHNEHQIDEAKDLAKKYNLNAFTTLKSSRYDEQDDLMPSSEWVGNKWNKRFNKEYNERYIHPRCTDGLGHYISAEGVYAPCCHMLSMPNATNSIYFQNDVFKIGNNTLEDMHNSDAFKLFTGSWNNYSTADITCQFTCGKYKNETVALNELIHSTSDQDHEIFY